MSEELLEVEPTITLPFLTATSFQLMIENVVKTTGMSYVEAVADFCEENEIAFSDVNKLLVGTNLKDKLKVCAIDAGYMREESSLPL